MSTLEITPEERQAYEKKVNEFRELGFLETEAGLLAAAQVPKHRAQALLQRGCPHQLAVRILL